MLESFPHEQFSAKANHDIENIGRRQDVYSPSVLTKGKVILVRLAAEY